MIRHENFEYIFAIEQSSTDEGDCLTEHYTVPDVQPLHSCLFYLRPSNALFLLFFILMINKEKLSIKLINIK